MFRIWVTDNKVVLNGPYHVWVRFFCFCFCFFDQLFTLFLETRSTRSITSIDFIDTNCISSFIYCSTYKTGPSNLDIFVLVHL